MGEGWSEPCYCPSSIHCCARPPDSGGKWEGWIGEDEGRLATRQTRHLISAVLTTCELVHEPPRCYAQLGCVDISVRYFSLLVDCRGPLPVIFWDFQVSLHIGNRAVDCELVFFHASLILLTTARDRALTQHQQWIRGRTRTVVTARCHGSLAFPRLCHVLLTTI